MNAATSPEAEILPSANSSTANSSTAHASTSHASTSHSNESHSDESTHPASIADGLAVRDEQVPRSAAVRHTVALARRSLLKTLRTPEALIDVTIQPIIFLVLFVYLFGGAISQSTHTYLEYVLPGLLVQSILFGSVAIGVNLNTDIEKGVFDRFRSLPIARSAPLVGAVVADVMRYVLLCVVLLSAGFVMGFRIHTNPVQMLAACLLSVAFALCLCWFSVLIGMLARSSGSVQGILFLTLFPITFGSNVFVQTATLPGWLQAFVKVNPATHLTSAVRGLMLGGPVAQPVFWTLVSMAAILAIFFPLAVRAYRRRA